MPDNIFSTYATAENRVTASVIAVIQSLSIRRASRLLGALLQNPAFELVRFQNQINESGDSIPDALVVSSCRILIETKTKPGMLNERQLHDHLNQFEGRSESDQKLLVLTPDEREPSQMKELTSDSRVVWASFASLDQAIDDLLDDRREVTSEREAYLLRELQVMLIAKELIGSAREVLVVPARKAWGDYELLQAYVCQNNRAFRQVKFLAFYVEGEIREIVPKIQKVSDNVVFQRNLHPPRLQEVVDGLLDAGTVTEGERRKVILLSGPADSGTLHLKRPIANDLISLTGRPTAFTQGQRYVSKDALLKASTTRELVELDDAKTDR